MPQLRISFQGSTISTLILIGYVLVFVAVIGLGWFSTSNIKQLQAITNDLYVHPFAVSNAATDMKGTLFQLRNHMIQIVLIRDAHDNVKQLYGEADAFAGTARADLAVIKAYFLGDMNRVNELEIKLDQWDAIRAEILVDVKKGAIEEAEHLFKTVGTPKFAELVPLVDYVQTFARNRGKSFADEAEQLSELIIFQMQWVVVFLMTFIVVTACAVHWRVRYLENSLNREATHDVLTGIPNRRYFMELMDRQLVMSQRYGNPFVLALADIDCFKTVNDTYGHHVGDGVLKHFTAACRKYLRKSDILSRIGGEEFAILLPNASLAEAQAVMKRVTIAIEEADIDIGQSTPLKITTSFGLADWSSVDKGVDAFFRRADLAMYEAKHRGRNLVCVSAS
jgi:diguanylate cyclase (GGDEF)-like protein